MRVDSRLERTKGSILVRLTLLIVKRSASWKAQTGGTNDYASADGLGGDTGLHGPGGYCELLQGDGSQHASADSQTVMLWFAAY
jgi:hypothetical protein